MLDKNVVTEEYLFSGATMTAASVDRLNTSNLTGTQKLFFYAQRFTLTEAYGIFEKVYGQLFTITYWSTADCEGQYDSLVQAGNMLLALYISLCYILGFEEIMPQK